VANIKKYYDLTGKLQDSQSFYEKPAQNYFLETIKFDNVQHVVEFGTGTGRFAQTLLSDYLPHNTRYTGFDISTTMVELASKNIDSFRNRAKVHLADVRKPLPLTQNSIDLIFAHFVFDMLNEEDLKRVLSDASGYLKKGGLLCLSNITHGSNSFSNIVMGFWQSIYRSMPYIVGYCKPIDLSIYLSEEIWQTEEKRFCSFGISVQTLKNSLY